ncbi:2-amino-4-hydroxy-6-hydroxymethyldihydropteridinediphosphokinase [soil metagenome]
MADPEGERWAPAYIGLGSNLDGPLERVREAFDELAQLPRTLLVARSSLYRSDPLGDPDQPRYVNAAAGLLTQQDPMTLLHELKSIEKRHGRRRTMKRWEPRTLDLDLLAYGCRKVDGPDLRLPHPEIAARNFVLCPLAEIAPFLTLKGQGTLASLAAVCDRGGLELIDGR